MITEGWGVVVEHTGCIMGAGPSATASRSAEVLAYRLAAEEFGRLESGFYESDYLDMSEIGMEERGWRVEEVYRRSVLQDEYLPHLVLHRWLALALEAQKAYLLTFYEAALERDKKTFKPKAPTADYSKSFSGSAADTANEKAAAALMRNDGGGGGDAAVDPSKADLEEANPLLRRPTFGRTAADINGQTLDKILLRRSAPWIKFLSASDCLVYAHPLTKEVVSVRPEEYEPELDPIAGSAAAGNHGAAIGGGAAAVEDFANGIPSCTLTDLPSRIEEIVRDGKTPLVLDPPSSSGAGEESRVRAFYSYKGLVADISSITVPFAKSGLRVLDHQEKTRQALVGAIKSGSVFCLYLGEVSSEHLTDFKSKFCKKDAFPIEALQRGGLKLLESAPGSADPRFRAVFRDFDLESGEATARAGFCALAVTTLRPKEYVTKLDECLPLAFFSPLVVLP